MSGAAIIIALQAFALGGVSVALILCERDRRRQAASSAKLRDAIRTRIFSDANVRKAFITKSEALRGAGLSATPDREVTP